MTLLLAALVNLAIILAVALSATLLMRRRCSAALRHWVLAAAILTGAASPALEFVLPEWPLPWSGGFTTAAPQFASTLRFTAEAAPVVTAPLAEQAPAGLPWTTIAAVAWMAGAIAGLLGLATGLVRLARFSARCAPIRSGPWRDTADELSARFRLSRVEMLQSTDPSLLVTWGLFTPRIILPAGASAWTDTRRRIVLAHEMAHIRRHDWLVHMGAEALRAIHWINPLAWLACRRLRQESEYACDDAVLSGGVPPTEYATHLLDVARQAIGHRRPFVSAPAIAHPSTLERRIAAMLTEQRNRAPLTRRAGIVALAAIVAVALPITALAVSRAAEPVPLGPDVVLTAQPVITAPPAAAPTATVTAIRPQPVTVAPAPNRIAPAVAQQAPPARLSVTVIDPSGAVLPGVEGAITDTQTGVRYRQVSDGAGRFSLAELIPGRYEMTLSLPGFATVGNVLQVAGGDNVQRTITLPIGSLQETITVVCGAPTAALAPVRPASAVAPDETALAAEHASRAWARREAAGLVLARVRDSREWQRAAFAQNGPLAPVRVGGQIAAPRQIAKVNPVCPRGVIPAPDTVVMLTARIGVDGRLNDVRYVPPAPGAIMPVQEIIDSALDAVRQWGYTPTRLNNVPVEANITVHVAYRPQ